MIGVEVYHQKSDAAASRVSFSTLRDRLATVQVDNQLNQNLCHAVGYELTHRNFARNAIERAGGHPLLPPFRVRFGLSVTGSFTGQVAPYPCVVAKPREPASHLNGTMMLSLKAPYAYTMPMTNTRIGYARCSTDKQDLTAQCAALVGLGVAADRIYTDHGFTGTNRARPGLDQALAAVRAGDTLVVPKLDRLARSVPDARDIADGLAARGVKLAIGASVYDPTDPMGKMFFNILATFAEFESDLIRLRTREGMAVARAKGKLRGKQPKLSDKQQKELRRMRDTGEYSISDLAELFTVSRPTVYRTLARVAGDKQP